MDIYIKNKDGSHTAFTAAALKNHLTSLKKECLLSGLCVETNGFSAQYLFTLDSASAQLRRYVIRIIDGKRMGTRMYQILGADSDRFDTTPQQDFMPIAIPSDSVFFTEDELKEITQTTQKPPADSKKSREIYPYLEESKLSRRQQRKLYLEKITGNPHIESFSNYLNNNILNNQHVIKILTASISQNPQDFFQEGSDESNEVHSLRYAFLAPNKIVFFIGLTTERDKYNPTVGDIIDYFTHCIQTVLKNLNAPCVAKINIQQFKDETRDVRVGDKAHQFDELSTYNNEGLVFSHDSIFRCLMLIFQQSELDNHVDTMQIIIAHPDFFACRHELRDVIFDLIQSIYLKSRTQLTVYLPVYNYLCSQFEASEWYRFTDHLKNAEEALLLMIPAKEVIDRIDPAVMPQLIRNKIVKLVENTDEKTFFAAHAELLILLYKANLFTKKNISTALSSNNPACLYRSLYFLSQKSMLDNMNLERVFSFRDQHQISNTLIILFYSTVLNNATFLRAIVNLNLVVVTRLFNFLHRFDRFDEAHFQAIVIHEMPGYWLQIVETINSSDCMALDGNLLDLIFGHANPRLMHIAVAILERRHILDQDNLSVLILHPHLDDFVNAVKWLDASGILSAAHFNLIKDSEFPRGSALIQAVLHSYANLRNRYAPVRGFFSVRVEPEVMHFITAFSSYVRTGHVSDLNNLHSPVPNTTLRVVLKDHGLLTNKNKLNFGKLSSNALHFMPQPALGL